MALIEINWKPDRRQLRGFGTICLVAFAAVGAWAYFKHSVFYLDMTAQTARSLAYALWAAGALCGALAVAAPGALRPFYVALTAFTLPIGWVVSHVVMGVLFYTVLTPIGIALRLARCDPLSRAFDPLAKTYWVPRERPTDVKRYFRQF